MTAYRVTNMGHGAVPHSFPAMGKRIDSMGECAPKSSDRAGGLRDGKVEFTLSQKIEKLFHHSAKDNPTALQQPSQATKMSIPTINQVLLERLRIYITKLSAAPDYTPEKIEIVIAFFNYLLTPDIKTLLSGSDEETARARGILLKKTDHYLNLLHERPRLLKAYPKQTEALEEVMRFLTDAPNENWTQSLRRSDRVRAQIVDRFNKSFQSDIEVYAQLTANIARLAELQGTGPRRPKVTIKILPRRSARLLYKV